VPALAVAYTRVTLVGPGERLTCEETEVVAALLATLGMPRQGLAWLVEHTQDDDEDDSHWDLRQQYPNGFE
jgi:hypothetical protein